MFKAVAVTSFKIVTTTLVLAPLAIAWALVRATRIGEELAQRRPAERYGIPPVPQAAA